MQSVRGLTDPYFDCHYFGTRSTGIIIFNNEMSEIKSASQANQALRFEYTSIDGALLNSFWVDIWSLSLYIYTADWLCHLDDSKIYWMWLEERDDWWKRMHGFIRHFKVESMFRYFLTIAKKTTTQLSILIQLSSRSQLFLNKNFAVAPRACARVFR